MERTSQLELLQDGADSLLRYANLLLSTASGDSQQAMLEQVRQQMREYARLQTELDVSELALRETKAIAVTALTAGEPVDLDDMPAAVVRLTEQKMMAAPCTDEHEKCRALARLEEVATQEVAAAVRGGDGEGDGDGDGELRMTDAHLATLDPWSKQQIRQPVRNRCCGHVYEHDSLRAALDRGRPPVCPYVGCTNKTPLSWQGVAEDLAAKRAIDRQLRTQSSGPAAAPLSGAQLDSGAT